MISTIVEKHGVRTLTTWYYDGKIIEIQHDIASHVEALTQPNKIESHEFATQIVDLTKSEEELFADIDKQCRYEIRRAKRDGVTHKFLTSNELSDDRKLNKCINFYNKFAQQKKLPPCQDQLLRQLRNNNLLIVSYAFLNDEVLACHIYVNDDTRTRLCYSSSLYRDMDKEKRGLIGRANRMLHWEDLMFFKEKSVAFYDWGGISYDPEHVKITKFKLEFGGETQKLYSYVQYKTLKGNLYSRITRYIAKWRKM